MKKRLVSSLLFFLCWQGTFAAISVRVCGPDGQIPFGYRDIMVGQKLTFIVSSDSDDYWSGAFFIEGDDRAVGRLSARDSDPNVRDFTDAHYPAAGDYADVLKWDDSVLCGYDMYSSGSNCVAGDWFIIDYIAKTAGQCQVNFYDYNTSWTEPNVVFGFEHAPSCDFNQDGIVNFTDFSQIATYWLIDNCNNVNDCVAVDLDFDSAVDQDDLAIFSEFWLWNGSISEPEPNIPPLPDPTPDPNIIYAIIDVNELDEIYLDPNESITLYVDLTTTDQNDLMAFDIEVHISEPNLGSIDNTEYPNGTAEILATPRFDLLDSWGPGTLQEAGIELSAFNFAVDPNNSISDGHLASFVYTASGTGDVTLSIVNISSQNMDNNAVYPLVQSILIHQVDPLMLPMDGGTSEAMMVPTMSLSVSTEPREESLTDIDEMIRLLEIIWEEGDLNETIDETLWQEFMATLKSI